MVKNWIQQLLSQASTTAPKEMGTAFAPVNIALIKYWGKRDKLFNLPITDSLSISLKHLGTHTQIRHVEGPDQITLNDTLLENSHPFYQRLTTYLDLFRTQENQGFWVHTRNDVPTGAGLASSASGYAALVLALNDLMQWQLSEQQLSILARIGSGSASRSLWNGFVHWHAGQQADGSDSFATPLHFHLPDLRVGLLTLSSERKKTSSRDGMQATVHGLSLYPSWPAMVKTHLTQLYDALENSNISRIGEIAEHNALAMHASMLSAYPALCYWQPETLASLQTLWQARETGLACWATLDAGPNVKLIFAKETEAEVKQLFPQVKVLTPFDEQ